MSICIKKYVKLLCTFSCLLIVDMHPLNTGIIGRRLKKLPKISRETRRTYLDNGYFNSSVFENLVPTGEKSTALIVHPTANATIASRVVRGRPAPYAQELDTTKKLFDKPFNQSQQLATDQVFAGRQSQRKLAEQAWQKEHGTSVIPMPEVSHSTLEAQQLSKELARQETAGILRNAHMEDVALAAERRKNLAREEAEYFAHRFKLSEPVGHTNSAEIAMELSPVLTKYKDPLTNTYLGYKGLKLGFGASYLYYTGGKNHTERAEALAAEVEGYKNMYGQVPGAQELVDEFIALTAELETAQNNYEHELLAVEKFGENRFDHTGSITALEQEIADLNNKRDQVRAAIAKIDVTPKSLLNQQSAPGTPSSSISKLGRVKNAAYQYGYDYIGQPLYRLGAYAAKPFSYGNNLIKNYTNVDLYNLGQRLLRVPGATYQSVMGVLKRIIAGRQKQQVPQESQPVKPA